tara:strand:+ start:1458 stop:1718 length:261 start_codon:yes stop_codon:yes gene_type:complete
MPNITVTITDTEEKCLNTVMVGIGTWADNFVTNRARIAKEDIISKLVKHCNSNSIALAVGADAQVTQAYAIGIAHTLTDVVALPSE